MDCPYCAESIKATARVCRHCGYDIALLRSEQARIRELEEEVANLRGIIAIREDQLDQARRQSQPLSTRYASVRPIRVIAVAIFMAAFIPIVADSVAFYLLRGDLLAGIDPESLLQLGLNLLYATLSLLNWFFPVFLGFAVAIVWQDPHKGWYAMLALLVGLLQAIMGIGAYELWAALGPPYRWNWMSHGWWFFIAFFVLPTFMFVTGGFIGDAAKLQARDPEKWLSGWAGRLAEIVSRRTRIIGKERLVSIIRYTTASSPIFLVLAIISLIADVIQIGSAAGGR